MEDEAIIQLFWKRSECAIRETEVKYGRLCKTIADNILHNEEDTLECLNDTYFTVWNAIPNTRPTYFSAFLCKITRNIALFL